MQRGTPTGMTKRQKELMRGQHRKEKEERKAVRRAAAKVARETGAAPGSEEGVDPDLAGIVPGPQPVPTDDD